MLFPLQSPKDSDDPVAEAALAGKPSIGTHGGSLPELIKHDFTGWLVLGNDPVKLCECLIEAASDLERTRVMGARARTLALENFTMSIHNKKILAAFERIFSKEPQL